MAAEMLMLHTSYRSSRSIWLVGTCLRHVSIGTCHPLHSTYRIYTPKEGMDAYTAPLPSFPFSHGVKRRAGRGGVPAATRESIGILSVVP